MHRVGRTGRCGFPGTAITLIKQEEKMACQDLMKMLIKFKQEIPEWFKEIVEKSNTVKNDKSMID